MKDFYQKALRVTKWMITICVLGFALVSILAFYHATETNAGLCGPGGKIVSSAMSSKGLNAEIHLCPDTFIGYHYYLETDPAGGYSEKHPSFGEGLPPPTVEWVDDRNLKVTVPPKMFYVDTVQIYNGIKILYVTGK